MRLIITLDIKPTHVVTGFTMNFPMPEKKRFGIFSKRRILIRLDGKQVFEKTILVIKNKLKFNLPKGMIFYPEDGKYTMEVETIS